MTTSKKKLTAYLKPETFKIIETISLAEGSSVSNVGKRLVEIAIENNIKELKEIYPELNLIGGNTSLTQEK